MELAGAARTRLFGEDRMTAQIGEVLLINGERVTTCTEPLGHYVELGGNRFAGKVGLPGSRCGPGGQ